MKKKKCSFGSCVRVGVFLCSAQSKGSDKVHVEATYCQSVLDNSATGEILEYTLRAWNWSQKKKKAPLLSVIYEHSFQNDPRVCSLINRCLFSPCCRHAESWLTGTGSKYHRAKRGLCSLTANACTFHGGMSDFWNVNLTGKCARQSTCTRWWGERERERQIERETSNPASLCTENASHSSLRCGAHHHSTFIHAFLSLHNNQCINYTQAQFTDPCSRQCCTTRSAESPRNPTMTHQFVLNDTKQKKRAHLFYLLVWSVSCVRWESSLSETHSILPLNIMSRGDGETSCGATWKRSPGLHRDTIKCRLTRCLDGDGKDAAATAPMKGYP